MAKSRRFDAARAYRLMVRMRLVEETPTPPP